MASIKLQFEIEGEKQVLSSINFAGKELSNFSKPLKNINKNLRDDFDIKKQGKKIGVKWQNLNPNYKLWKDKFFPGKPTLIRTGAMNNSWKSFTNQNQTTITNKAKYFKYHQSNKPRKKLPRREMMKLSPPQQKMIFEQFTRYLNEVAKHFNK